MVCTVARTDNDLCLLMLNGSVDHVAGDFDRCSTNIRTFIICLIILTGTRSKIALCADELEKYLMNHDLI